MSRHTHPCFAVLGACVAAVGLTVGGGFPACATPDMVLVPAGVDAGTLRARDCDTMAKACTWDLTPTTVTFREDEMAYLKFTVAKSGGYAITTSNMQGDFFTEGFWISAADDWVQYYQTLLPDGNVKITADFVAGTVYYLVLDYWDEGSGSLTISFGDADPCRSRGTACDWDLTPKSVSLQGSEAMYLKFTVPRTGAFAFVSSNRSARAAPSALLLDSSGEFVNGADSSTSRSDFKFAQDLVAGEVFYLVLSHSWEGGSGSFTVSMTDAPPCSTFLSACEWNLAPRKVANSDPNPTFLKITAAQTATFTFTSTHPSKNTTQVAAFLLDSQEDILGYSSGGADGQGFEIKADLTAGEVYLLGFFWLGDTAGFTVKAYGPGSPTGTKPPVKPQTKKDAKKDTKFDPNKRTVKAGVVKIKGKAKVGVTLKAKVSKFTKGVKYSYAWYRNGKKIKGATKPTYKLKKADRGKKISVKVTAKKAGMNSATVVSKARQIPRKGAPQPFSCGVAREGRGGTGPRVMCDYLTVTL